MPISYPKPGTVLSAGSTDTASVKALQRDLRALGYLRQSIDGDFGKGTAEAVRALTYDLLHNHGGSTQNDGGAPMAISSHNKGRVDAVTDGVDEDVAGCIASLLNDPAIPKLPSSADPAAANREALSAIREMAGTPAPPPFMAAMVRQESSGQHFRVPAGNNEDNFVVVGLDRNKTKEGLPEFITSRGYGIGQYTIFHHPPRADEVSDFIVDPVRNVGKAFREFREKFDRWVLGPDDKADDRVREHPLLKDLRLCRYQPNDKRFMRDCRNCAVEAPKVDIQPGTPVYPGASFGYTVTQYYSSAVYDGVPDRAAFRCDWPYAARRYNGSGVNSFHYQTRILRNLLAEPPVTWS